MRNTITVLIFILILAAIAGITSIAYILSIAAERTTVTTVYTLSEATQLANECQGAHRVELVYDGWVVRCRN